MRNLSEEHHSFMRTTLTLDDDVLEVASKRASYVRISLGKAVSELARWGLQSSLPIKEVNGTWVFDPPAGAPTITQEKVKKALSEFP
jgi:hypothetical protein